MSEPLPPVLLEDAWLLAVAKPAGWESVVQDATSPKCLTTLLRDARGESELEPAHRLDRDTTGVQLFGRDPKTTKRLHSLFRTRQVRKAYLGICFGIPPNARGTIRRRLSRWGGGRRAVKVLKGRGGLEAETTYERLTLTTGTAPALPASLLLFRPLHGRTHQVRVHASALGYPILGDDQYGDRPANRQVKQATGLRRQALHAWRLSLLHPETGDAVRIEAPPPADLDALCTHLFSDWPDVLAAAAWE